MDAKAGAQAKVAEVCENLLDLSRRIHANPELAYEEIQASALLAEPLTLLLDNFAVARKVSNFVSEQYLRYSRNRVFDVGIS